MQSSARSHLDTHHTHWPLTRTCSLSLHLHSLKVSILFWSGKPEKTFSTYKHQILQHRMRAVKQTASEYLGYCVLIGDIIHHTNHISLCGSEKTAWRYYSQKSNVYLTVVASREGTHTASFSFWVRFLPWWSHLGGLHHSALVLLGRMETDICFIDNSLAAWT